MFIIVAAAGFFRSALFGGRAGSSKTFLSMVKK